MTTLDRSPARPPLATPAPASVAGLARLLVIAVAAGGALGAGDLWVMMHVHHDWAFLANSSAVWALGAFALGAALRTDPPRAAVAGVVMLLVAVEAYYGYAGLLGMAGRETLYSENTRMWLTFAVVAGVVFGVAGAWTSGRVRWQRALGAATGAGVLVGEALHLATHPSGSAWPHLAGWMGVVGLGVLAVSARSPRVLVPAAVLLVPMAVFSAAGFSAVGIGY